MGGIEEITEEDLAALISYQQRLAITDLLLEQMHTIEPVDERLSTFLRHQDLLGHAVLFFFRELLLGQYFVLKRFPIWLNTKKRMVGKRANRDRFINVKLGARLPTLQDFTLARYAWNEEKIPNTYGISLFIFINLVGWVSGLHETEYERQSTTRLPTISSIWHETWFQANLA